MKLESNHSTNSQDVYIVFFFKLKVEILLICGVKCEFRIILLYQNYMKKKSYQLSDTSQSIG